ncbi:RINT-1 family protein [Colletotrichum graminicola]|uniref:RINT-1 family protein n=1 Tax=Colletotrichum graminicola (strain M1.001 / M2 / FGSC 10212) TaxID=645133 RepID=E3Q8Z4_COLGM|nr:RINT-1 family protein [Colletotrichum graminicola M1.001]EFQ27508.1 RINT-1 family protein [Colletotrichum graminicola M1.001]WDK13327.1 RINT-1 family protein [Colletotrichum graminicola]
MATIRESHPQTGALDIRVEDFLDDKLQSTTDLENLDSLIANVEVQRSQLQTQLDNAIRQLDEARRTAGDRQSSLVQRVQDFQELQHSIDVRVKIAAASDAPNQAIARLQQPMKKLQTIELAQSYLCLLQDVEKLRTEARSHLPESPKAALEPYSKLKQLSRRLEELSGPADDAAVHLVNHVRSVADALWDEMKKTMSGELEAVLSKRSWPMVEPTSEMDEEWLACFEKLLDLQIQEVILSKSTVTLLPFDVMSRIFVSEFRFHFLSDKPTSKPDAVGSHCFPWFLATIEKWEDFFRDNLGLTLAAKFRDTPAVNSLVYIDPVCAFITSMLPVLKEKVQAVVADTAKNPAFLSNFIGQLMTFDETVRTKFNYDGGNAEQGWPGLATEILEDWFEPWFQAEKEFALERFRAIMATPDARNIDYDYAATGKTKPTFGAVRVTDLLRSITTQYERVRTFKHKMRFLIGIQLDILDEFHDRLRGSLEAYQALTSTVGRTLHGVTKEQLAALEGTGSLESLCKVYGSADHVVNTLKDWGNEEFFVTLWDQLQGRATKEGEPSRMSGEMSYEEVKDRTSAAVGSEGDEGVLFDETIAAYSLRRKTAQDFLVNALADSHYKAFRAYSTRTHWTTISDSVSDIDPSQLAVTPELDEPLRILKRNFDFLLKAIGTASFRRTWRAALDKLQEMLWGEVLMRQSFTAFGAAQFTRDLNAIFALVERYIPNGVGSLGSLADALKLLNLATEPQDGTLSLKDATDRVFTDNAEAKKLLEELDIDTLTPANARHILQRRVENKE